MNGGRLGREAALMARLLSLDLNSSDSLPFLKVKTYTSSPSPVIRGSLALIIDELYTIRLPPGKRRLGMILPPYGRTGLGLNVTGSYIGF
jgi:hypothetical protein